MTTQTTSVHHDGAARAEGPSNTKGGRRRPGPITITVLFCIGWAFMYADRNILSPVTTLIGEQWGIDKAQLGLLSTVFFAAYALMQVPTGHLADRLGRVRMVVMGYIVFGVATLLSGLAPGFFVFLLTRVLAGIGEGTYYSPVYGISSAQVPERWRGLAAAVINSGMALGISMGYIGSSYFTFTLGWGWQATFLIFGLATVLIAWAVHHFLSPLDAEQREQREQREAEAKAEGASLRDIFTLNHILTYVIVFCSLYGFFSMLTWLPAYLEQARGIDRAQTGIIASLVPWASIPGAVLLSIYAKRLKSVKPLIVVLGLLAAACQIAVPLVDDFNLVIVGLVIYGLVGKLALDPLLIEFLATITSASMYSRVYGYFNFAGMLSSIFAPYLTGALADASGSLESGFILSGVILTVGSIAFCFARPVGVPRGRAVR